MAPSALRSRVRSPQSHSPQRIQQSGRSAGRRSGPELIRSHQPSRFSTELCRRRGLRSPSARVEQREHGIVVDDGRSGYHRHAFLVNDPSGPISPRGRVSGSVAGDVERDLRPRTRASRGVPGTSVPPTPSMSASISETSALAPAISRHPPPPRRTAHERSGSRWASWAVVTDPDRYFCPPSHFTAAELTCCQVPTTKAALSALPAAASSHGPFAAPPVPRRPPRTQSYWCARRWADNNRIRSLSARRGSRGGPHAPLTTFSRPPPRHTGEPALLHLLHHELDRCRAACRAGTVYFTSRLLIDDRSLARTSSRTVQSVLDVTPHHGDELARDLRPARRRPSRPPPTRSRRRRRRTASSSRGQRRVELLAAVGLGGDFLGQRDQLGDHLGGGQTAGWCTWASARPRAREKARCRIRLLRVTCADSSHHQRLRSASIARCALLELLRLLDELGVEVASAAVGASRRPRRCRRPRRRRCSPRSRRRAGAAISSGTGSPLARRSSASNFAM